MHTSFYVLTSAEREEISRGLEAGKTFTAIAEELERPTSTVSREVARGGGRAEYRALLAEQNAQLRMEHRKRGKRILFASDDDDFTTGAIVGGILGGGGSGGSGGGGGDGGGFGGFGGGDTGGGGASGGL